ncbi:MAG: flagellar hook-length control protein FliK [Treponema sp.]|nr:flagellar hook-length control protein FliK [Treponema sp.]
MVITVSTYTEPAFALIDPPQSNEPEESKDNSGSTAGFAEILAGLLQKTGGETEAESGSGVQSADFSGETETEQEKAGLFGISSEEAAEKAAEVPETELSETETSLLFAEILASAENLLVKPENPVFTEAVVSAADTAVFSGEISREMPDIELAENLAVEPDTDFLSMPEIEEILTRSVTEADFPRENVLPKTEIAEAPPVENRLNVETASLRVTPEKENISPSEETNGRDKRRDKVTREKVTFEVRDMRTASQNADAPRSAVMRLNAGAETRVQNEGSVREMTLELRLPDQGQNQAPTQWEAKAGAALEDLLARELHQNFNNDIVRHASMALRDEGEGTIRLALKPESLGNVKIRLEMAENKITGHIVVESEEALRAFRKEIQSLEQAFRDSGFASAELNLSLTADGRNMEGREQEASSFTPQMAASRYDDSFEQAEASLVDVHFRQGPGSIDMLA